MPKVRSYAPGRTEIAGNHTDHQGGRVIAAGITCGIEMLLEDRPGMVARIESDGFPAFEIDLGSNAPCGQEKESTRALVRGVVAGLRSRGVPVEGFSAQVRSTVPSGGGLSSSAAFELALGAGLQSLFSDEPTRVSPTELALVGQAAERDYFGKPCGLMDQLSVAHGGVCLFDFYEVDQPAIEHIEVDLSSLGYTLCLVDTHCDHSLYAAEYSQVPVDMARAASFLEREMLSRVSEDLFMDNIAQMRSALGDLPVLRGLHYYCEMKLVDQRAQSLRDGDIEAFLAATRRSAASSAQYLQNVSCMGHAAQPAMVALALCDAFLDGEGAYRIHGGGFGGSCQAFVPNDRVDYFKRMMDSQLGEASCLAYDIDKTGVCAERA